MAFLSGDTEHTAADGAAHEPRGCGPLFLAIMLVLAALWGAGLGIFVYVLDSAEETIVVLEDFRPKTGSIVYSSDGEMLGEFAIEARDVVPLNAIPVHVQKAFVATEDDEFFSHRGVRPLSLAKAVFEALQTNRLRGASTITQQIVRNVEGTGVTKEETVQRKLLEMLVALQVERRLTKDELLEMYLNQIFLGISAHGVEAAAQQYFAKSISDVTLAEGAMLAGLTRSPNAQQPFRSPENALARRNIVLAQMLRNGLITQVEHDAAINESLDDSVVTPEERAELEAQSDETWKPGYFEAAHFVEEVRKFISNPGPSHDVNTSQEELFEGGLEVFTTIDMRLQRAAEEVLFAALEEFDAKKLESLKEQGREDEFVPVTGALVCLDNRRGPDYDYRGFVRAMVGGRDYESKKFNVATQAKRQPGSSIKPFVWLAALDNGMTPSSIVIDEPFVQIDGSGGEWTPQNFDREFSGPISIRKALERSVNIVSVKLVEQFTLPVVRSYLRDAGFRQPISDVAGLTLGLGTEETTVLDQAVSYSTFVNGGVRVDPTLVTRVVDRDGIIRYDERDYRDVRTHRVFEPDVSYQMVHLLQGVCEPARDYSVTGGRTARLGRPRGGKTGTTNRNRSVWFCGFTPQYTCVVFIGYDNNDPLGRGVEYTGGRLASPVWTDFMIQAHQGLPIENFKVPPNVEFHKIDRATGVAGGDYSEAYIRGTRPPLQLPYWFYDVGEGRGFRVIEGTPDSSFSVRPFPQQVTDTDSRFRSSPRAPLPGQRGNAFRRDQQL